MNLKNIFFKNLLGHNGVYQLLSMQPKTNWTNDEAFCIPNQHDRPKSLEVAFDESLSPK